MPEAAAQRIDRDESQAKDVGEVALYPGGLRYARVSGWLTGIVTVFGLLAYALVLLRHLAN